MRRHYHGRYGETRMTSPTLEDAVALMRMEYAELPGLKLTAWQAQRLWGLPQDVCDRALAALIAEGRLVRTVDGAYARHPCHSDQRPPTAAQAGRPVASCRTR
jgi:hypothetical protein